jgi:hypothetical protein
LKKYYEEEIVKKNEKDIVLIDLTIEFDYEKQSPEDQIKFWDDNLHYSEIGYEKLSKIIFNSIIKYIDYKD